MKTTFNKIPVGTKFISDFEHKTANFYRKKTSETTMCSFVEGVKHLDTDLKNIGVDPSLFKIRTY